MIFLLSALVEEADMGSPFYQYQKHLILWSGVEAMENYLENYCHVHHLIRSPTSGFIYWLLVYWLLAVLILWVLFVNVCCTYLPYIFLGRKIYLDSGVASGCMTIYMWMTICMFVLCLYYVCIMFVCMWNHALNVFHSMKTRPQNQVLLIV